MRERAALFGSSLVGVMSEPDGPSPDGRPAFIFVNALLIHRAGPNRLYVKIARALANLGFVALRFDLSGRGDSETRTDGLAVEESSVVEIQEAMAYLSRVKGVRTFVLLGLCAGAHDTFRCASAEPRVVGAALIDPYVFPTLQYYLRYYARRLMNVSSWRNTLSGQNAIGRRLQALWARRDPAALRPTAEMAVPDAAVKAATAAALARIIDRGTRLLLVFSGSVDTFNYRSQFAHSFPGVNFRDRVTVEYYPEADHTFTRRSHQELLTNTVLGWVERAFVHTAAPDATSHVIPSRAALANALGPVGRMNATTDV